MAPPKVRNGLVDEGAPAIEVGGGIWRTEQRISDTPLPGAPNVGFRVPQTLEIFELWGVCGDLNLPSLPTCDTHSLAC